MASIAEIAGAMETILSDTANALARPSGFVKRVSKLSGSLFAKTTVLGWLKNPDSSLEELTQVAAGLGVQITPQALDERFGPEAATFLRQLLYAATLQLISAEPVTIPILSRFSGVVLDDSSIVSLPDELSCVWQGTGERTGHNQAALKLGVRLDLLSGNLRGPLLEPGRAQDRSSPLQGALPKAGSLRVTDLGFFSLDVMQKEHSTGSYYLSRLQVRTAVFGSEGRRVGLEQVLAAQRGTRLELRVSLGIKQHLPARLLAERVPMQVAQERRRRLKTEARHKGQAVSKARLALADWTILVTNAPSELLSIEEALVLYRARWQIEMLFRLWKQHGQIDNSRSKKPWRILCELYAKLLGMMIQHWLLLVSCWPHPDRSLVKAASTVRDNTALLIAALRGRFPILTAIRQIQAAISLGCRMNSRRKAPNTYQLLLSLDSGALA